jgi:hypothetical protein
VRLWLAGIAALAILALANAGVITQSGPRYFTSSSSSGGGIAVGAHGKDVDLDTQGTSPSTVAIDTQATGSVCIAFLSGQHTGMSTPSDNKGNTFTQRGPDADYGGLWTGFGLEIWAVDSCAGGTSHTLSVTKTLSTQESSIAFIEISDASSVVTPVQSYNSSAGAGVEVDGPNITVDGPAIICSAASGDGNSSTTNQTLTPSRGTLVESSFIALTDYVPFAIACDTVTEAGTYDIDWTPTFNQGMAKITWAVQ